MKWMQFLTPVASIDTEEAKAYLRDHKEGSYTLLDVRQPSEYKKGHIPGARLIPLPELAGRLGELDPQKPVVAYCAIGGRSRAAAQFLAGQGFDKVYNLKGGIAAWQGLKAFGPAEMGMIYLRGNETPQEVIVLAYGMEQGLADFYSRVSGITGDREAREIIGKLVGIEEKHKDRLFALYQTLEQSTLDRKLFEDKVLSGVMEGGFTGEEFLEKNKLLLNTVENLLSLAMMLEAQALDLYTRYAQKVEDVQSRSVLHDIAEDEKGHLATLGSLLGARG
jgi:rhodanese-related sulfurtransferase/rubrerythrin